MKDLLNELKKDLHIAEAMKMDMSASNDKKNIFVNPSGVPNDLSMYGISLSSGRLDNDCGESEDEKDGPALNVVLNNVYIHDLVHDSKETVGMETKEKRYAFIFFMF